MYEAELHCWHTSPDKVSLSSPFPTAVPFLMAGCLHHPSVARIEGRTGTVGSHPNPRCHSGCAVRGAALQAGARVPGQWRSGKGPGGPLSSRRTLRCWSMEKGNELGEGKSGPVRSGCRSWGCLAWRKGNSRDLPALYYQRPGGCSQVGPALFSQ